MNTAKLMVNCLEILRIKGYIAATEAIFIVEPNPCNESLVASEPITNGNLSFTDKWSWIAVRDFVRSDSLLTVYSSFVQRRHSRTIAKVPYNTKLAQGPSPKALIRSRLTNDSYCSVVAARRACMDENNVNESRHHWSGILLIRKVFQGKYFNANLIGARVGSRIKSLALFARWNTMLSQDIGGTNTQLHVAWPRLLLTPRRPKKMLQKDGYVLIPFSLHPLHSMAFCYLVQVATNGCKIYQAQGPVLSVTRRGQVTISE